MRSSAVAGRCRLPASNDAVTLQGLGRLPHPPLHPGALRPGPQVQDNGFGVAR